MKNLFCDPAAGSLSRAGHVLCLCLLFSSCALQREAAVDDRLSPMKSMQPVPAETAALKKPAEQFRNELLEAIPLSDIAAAQAEVKRHILPHWPIIAERSTFVRTRMEKVLHKLEAPEGLLAVPVVESGYNPYALSPAGAMGLWQLMPRTARGLGAVNDKGQNARRDVESSSEAAVAYLLRLKERFGNWPLALAAYNYGPTAVSRRLAKSPWKPEQGLNSMPVPTMTRIYVRHVIGFAALLHMKSVEFPEAIATREVRLAPPVDLTQLASLAGLKRDLLFKLNPGLDHSQYLNEEVTLYVPESHWQSIEPQIEAIAPEYVDVAIRPGDSLWTLARRHHTTVGHLRKLNSGLGSVLSIGKTIRVPANQLARATPAPNPLLNKGRGIRYKVRSGDNLWTIAQRFGTTARAIARSNQISMNTLIRPGDTLWILARIRPS